MLEFPEDFTPHPKLVAIFKRRADALAQGKGIDWGYAEALALGSLLLERVPVRLTGQDSRRGTFGHRHLGIDDHKTGERYTPFSVLAEEGQTQLALYNSTLSEAAVVGFEFGFSCEAQQGLVMWEAQFGDFANGAQVLIDQFIAASEAKWNQLSGLVLLLPHGFEGMGPEHSSARLERYLQLCSEGNMSVCYPSNAAQYFHMLRRQGVSPIKRPLIVMTPKSLLRYPGASVDLAALESGSFAPVLEETNGAGSKHLLFMSGKIYHDLVAGLSEEERANANLIRVEELYPFPAHEVRQILERAEYKSVQWVQEEPRNNGAWLYIEHAFITELDTPISYIGRPSSPSVAGGSPKRHSYEQQSIVEEVRGLISPD